MKDQLNALSAELLKCRRARITWVTFVAFGLAPVMGGVFMVILNNPALSKSGMLASKAAAMAFSPGWQSYLSILSQAVGVGGVLVFGFVASWVFGREYSDGTAKDLLALPVSRSKIVDAKFLVYTLWCVALAVSNLLAGFFIGILMGFSAGEVTLLVAGLKTYAVTVVMTILIGSPIAFFAIWGKGYLAPLGFVALTLVFAQVIAAAGLGYWFPWSIPGLYSGAAGEYRHQLDFLSYSVPVMTFVLGYLVTQLWMKYADHK